MLVVANFVDLSAIASVGSACSLIDLPARRRSRATGVRADTGANAAIVLARIGGDGVVLAFFAVDTLRNAPETFVAIVAIARAGGRARRLWKRLAGDAAGRPVPTAAA